MITRFWAESAMAVVTMIFGLGIVYGALDFGVGWERAALGGRDVDAPEHPPAYEDGRPHRRRHARNTCERIETLSVPEVVDTGRAPSLMDGPGETGNVEWPIAARRECREAE